MKGFTGGGVCTERQGVREEDFGGEVLGILLDREKTGDGPEEQGRQKGEQEGEADCGGQNLNCVTYPGGNR